MAGADELARRARLVAAPGGDVPSPCIAVCRMDVVSGLCEGCHRTLDEIAAWSRLDDEAKRALWRVIAERAAATSQEEAKR